MPSCSQSLYVILTNFLPDLYGLSDVMLSPRRITTVKCHLAHGQIAQPSFSEEDRTSDQKGIKLHCMRGLLRKAVAVSTFPSMLVLSLALAPRCYAQTPAQPEAPTKVAELHRSEQHTSELQSLR